VDGAGSNDDQETVIALLDNLDCLVTTRANGLGGTGRLFEAIAVSLVFKMRSIAQSGVQKKKKFDSRRGSQSAGIAATAMDRIQGLTE
jgi:hypothetical protein